MKFLCETLRLIKDSVNSKGLLFGTLSSAFEWYDYALFGYFTSIIGAQFFPSSDPVTSLLSSFAVFASGFAMRPLGALFFGYIGDRVGRKRALILSLILMAIPTMSLGILPNYEKIGIYASIGLVLIRLLQGLAVGGNYGGSFIFTIESAKRDQRGLSGSLAMFGTLGGLFLGSSIAALMEFMLSPSALQSYGWRIPFVLGGFSGPVAYWIRHFIPEVHMEAKRDVGERQQEAPAKLVLKNHLGSLFAAMGIILLDGVGVYLLFVFMTTFADVFLHLPHHAVLTINSFAMAGLVVMIPLFGRLGDIIGQRKILLGVSLAFIFLALPLYAWIISAPSLLGLAVLQAIFCVAVGAAYGALPVAVVGAFPQDIRYTACSLAFNISVAVFGGTAPYLATWLIKSTGSLFVPAFMLVIVGILSFISARSLRKSYF